MKNKTSITILIGVLTVLIISLITFLTLALVGKFNFGQFYNESKIIYEETYLADEFNKITVKTVSADVTFKNSNTDEIRVIVNGKDETDVNVVTDNNELSIDYDGKGFCIGFCFDTKSIVVYVPSDYDGDLDIKSTSGDIELTAVESQIIKVKSVSGDVNIKKSHNIEVGTTSGDIHINSVTNKCTMKTVSGRIKIKDLQIFDNSSIKTTSGDVTIDSISDVFVEAKTVSGDKEINTNNRKADVELKINTVSGDIEIE